MYCMHCGNEIADNSRYCKYCGKLVAEDEMVKEEKVEDSVIDQTAYIDESAIENIDEDSVKIENKEREVLIDDIFFQHISKKKRIALFFIAILMTAIVAVVVFKLFPRTYIKVSIKKLSLHREFFYIKIL